MSKPWNMGRQMGGIGQAVGLRHAFDEPPPPPGPAFDRQLLARVLACFRPYRGRAILAAITITLTALLGLIPPLLVRGLLDTGIPQGKEVESAWPLLPYVLGLVLVPLAVGLIGLVQQVLTLQIGQGILGDLRDRLFGHLRSHSLHYYTTTRSGEIVARVWDDVGAVEGAVSGTLVEILTNALTVIGTIVVLFAVSWPLALAACATLPVFLVPARRVGRWRRQLVGEAQQKQAELLGMLHDVLNVGGFLLMRLFGRGDYEAERFAQHSREVRELRIRQSMAGRWLLLLITVLGALGPAGVYWYGGYLVIQGAISVGTVVAFVAYLSSLYRPTTRLAGVYVECQAALGVFQRIFDLLDQQPDVQDRPGATTLGAVRGEITFENVGFTYRAGQRPAVCDVSFHAEPGQLVALVGPSGAGKTTVTYLVPRFYDPQAGRVLLDGHDVRDVTQESLLAQVGMVTQDPFLFHATVRDNLLYSRPEATEDELVAACRAAHIHDFIVSLPDGYDTVVGERGVKLSGGERQRLAIARALLKDPRVLILDEATSALDSVSERLIQSALAPLMRGRTTLAIAHRLSTVLAADLILVMDEGRLVEQGTHAELLARGGLYARLYREQFERQATDAAEVVVSG